jgi:hypothetical protein
MPEILASHENSGGFLKYWRVSETLAGVQNIGGCPKYWRLQNNQAALLFGLGGIFCCRLPPGLAEELSFRSSLRHVDPKWETDSLHAAFICALSPVLYRLDKPKFARQSKIYADLKILGVRIYFENFRS